MMNPEDKTMLALAALTYRGYGHHSDAVIAGKLDPWLAMMAGQGLGSWERVWGPASFRAPTSLVDDAMVYVVKQKDVPAGGSPRYVVALRGTNPISLFDWVFGDFWVRHRIDWDGAPGVGISASTALGLAIIQNLTSSKPPARTGGLAPFANAITSALQGLGSGVMELLPQAVLRRPPLFSDKELLDRIGTLSGQVTAAIGSGIWGRLREHFDETTRPVREFAEQQAFELLLRTIVASRAPGTTLLSFLTAAVEPNAEVVVTGHSKGGALALATALWLQERFAPAKHATIRCFSFAGPTAGDGEFVKRYDAALGDRTRRIVNVCDLVPQAWTKADLLKVDKVYPLLAAPTVALARVVGGLGYAHVGGECVSFGTKPAPGLLVEQLIHNHMNAYLIEAGFTVPWTAESIFLDPM